MDVDKEDGVDDVDQAVINKTQYIQGGVDVDQEDGVDVDQAVIDKARHIQGGVVRDTRIRMQTSCLSHSATLSLTLLLYQRIIIFTFQYL